MLWNNWFMFLAVYQITELRCTWDIWRAFNFLHFSRTLQTAKQSASLHWMMYRNQSHISHLHHASLLLGWPDAIFQRNSEFYRLSVLCHQIVERRTFSFTGFFNRVKFVKKNSKVSRHLGRRTPKQRKALLGDCNNTRLYAPKAQPRRRSFFSGRCSF